jgi:hypothetical protein
LLYSARCTTTASLPTITTLPTRSSCAVFMLKTPVTLGLRDSIAGAVL